LPDFENVVNQGQNFFIFACFGDLKNYDFFYRIGLISGTDKLLTVKGKKIFSLFKENPSMITNF
jgi:hypothetical protein